MHTSQNLGILFLVLQLPKLVNVALIGPTISSAWIIGAQETKCSPGVIGAANSRRQK